MSGTEASQGVTGSSSSESTSATTSGSEISKAVSEEMTSGMTISNVGDLKAKAPVFYEQMMQALAQKICKEMKRHQEHLKETRRKYESMG